MKIKRICMIMLAAVMMVTGASVYVNAVSTFDSPQAFIEDVIDYVNTTGSTDITDISVLTVGDQVFYNGVSIGYWFEDSSSTLYGDANKESVLISANDGDTYIINEDTLQVLKTANNTTQTLTTPGSSASVEGGVEVEERSFKVIVPAFLPMAADTEGNVATATNASIINQSSAPVKITGVSVAANAESGWTLVDTEPSKERGAKEFSFATSLKEGTVINQNDELKFTYNAKMSPIEDGVTTVNIVTVGVTLDWED